MYSGKFKWIKVQTGRNLSFLRFPAQFLPHASLNSILRGVCETKFFDTTNHLAAIRFMVLATKPLVVSKKFTSQTPLEIEF